MDTPLLDGIRKIALGPATLQGIAQQGWKQNLGMWDPKRMDVFARLAKRLDPKNWKGALEGRSDIAFGKAPTKALKKLFGEAGIKPVERISVL